MTHHEPNPVEPSRPRRTVTTADVEQLEKFARTWRGEDYRFGGGSCRDAILGYLNSHTTLLETPTTEPVRIALRVALADLHNLAGWTCFDSGQPGAAHTHFRTALSLAREAGHDALVANIHYRIGRVHLHHGALGNALAEFRLGEDAARKCGSLHAVALLIINQAWTSAEMGRADDAMALLDAGSSAFTRADRTDLPPWAVFFDDIDLGAMTGTVQATLARLVDTRYARSAIPALSDALAAYPNEMARSTTFCLISLATCHVLAGDADEANNVVSSVLEASRTLRSVRPRDRMRPLRAEADRRRGNAVLRHMAERIGAFQLSESTG
jgi:tetratricopeptide (TPR) repeat protein